MTTHRPTGLPEGIVAELCRGRVLPGASAGADRRMLDDRHDECVATLDRERMAVEAERATGPGRVEAEPQVVPEPVAEAVFAWAGRPVSRRRNPVPQSPGPAANVV